MLAVALVAIGIALGLGFSRKGSLLRWRWAKFISAILGSIGIVMLLFNFEKTVRDIVVKNTRDYVFEEFVDIKFFIAQKLILACSKDQAVEQNKLTCFDYRNIDGQVSLLHVRAPIAFNKIVNWQRNPAIDDFVSELNRRLEIINQAFPVLVEDRSIISNEARINMVAIAILLVIGAVACSAGEAAYQIRATT